MKREGLLWNMLEKYHVDESKWGRVRFAPHPALAVEMADFVLDAVLYTSTLSMIESLTLGPREGRISLYRFRNLITIPWVHYWKVSSQNPSGLDSDEIDQEYEWQQSVHGNSLAEEGCFVPHRVHSSKGRHYELGLIHTLSTNQFKGTGIVPGANVLMLTKLMNEERRDKQMSMDELTKQGTQDIIVALAKSEAFRKCVISGSPISLSGGTAISTAPPECHKFPPMGGGAHQPPDVLPWDNTGPPLPDEDPPPLFEGKWTPPPPPHPPLSSAPAESQDAPPPPPPPVTFGPSARETERTERLEGSGRKRSKSKTKMPKEESEDGEWMLQGKWVRRHCAKTIGESETDTSAHGAISSAGLPRQSDDQADFGATQVGPGSFPIPPVDPEILKSVPSKLFETPYDATEGEKVIEETLPKTQAVGPGFGRGPARSRLDHIYTNCAESSATGVRNWDGYGLKAPQLCKHHSTGIKKTFDSADVWACYVPNFLEWEEFQNRYNPFTKIKQAVDNCQFWSQQFKLMVNGQEDNKGEGENTLFWNIVGACAPNQTMT